VLSKVLERGFHDQLVSYLLKFNLLSDRQSAIDESKYTAAAFLDVSKKLLTV